MNPISDAEIWDRYQAGASSREIAAAVGMSPAGVRYRIIRGGHRMREGTHAAAKKRWKPIVWRGVRFTPDAHGYLMGYAKPYRFKALHRAIWEAHHGPVPAGWYIAFKDCDRTNVALDNLELRKGNGHRRPSTLVALPERTCPACRATLVRKAKEKTYRWKIRRFCSAACANVWRRGRSRTQRLAKPIYAAATSPRESGRARAERVFGRQGITP